MDPNGNTAEIYDLVSLPQKPFEATDEEIALVNSLTPPPSKILDIACGTGRHLIPLAKQKFQLTGVEKSNGMFSKLKSNIVINELSKNVNIYNNNIFEVDFKNEKFDLVVMFWNSFNEICLTKKSANSLLKKLKQILEINGKILININDSESVDPSNFDFKTVYDAGEKKYELNWKTHKYFRRTNTATSKETVRIYEKDILKFESESLITQRYWKLSELENLFKANGLNFYLRKLATSNELYLVIYK